MQHRILRALLTVAVLLAIAVPSAGAKVLQQKTLTATPSAATWTSRVGGDHKVYVSIYSRGRAIGGHDSEDELSVVFYGQSIFLRATIQRHAVVVRYVSLARPQRVMIRIEG